MIGAVDARTAIESLFKSGFEAARPSVEIRNTNVRFQTAPLEEETTENPGDPWVALDIVEGPDPEGGTSVQKTLGAKTTPGALLSYAGQAIVGVFVEKNTDTILAYQIAEDAAAALDRKTAQQGASGPIRFGVPYPGPSFPDDSGWFQVQVIAPFRRSVFN